MINKPTYYILVISLFVGLLFTACKKTELDDQTTTLIIKVNDDLGNVLAKNDVAVYLFDDSTAFRLAWQNDNPSQNIASTVLNAGQTTFDNLDPDKNYWVYIDYTNESGARINNFFTQNTLKNLLEDGAITTVSIQLTPYETGHIAFYSTELSNQDDLSINVFVDGNSISGELTGLAFREPESINEPNVLKFLYQSPGVHTYYAVGNNGCVWQGVFTIESGSNNFTKINLSACNYGYIDFWVDDSNFPSYGNVSVILNDNDDVGTITSSRSSVPSNCEKVDVLQVARPPGKYVVHAYATNQQCVWVQEIEIKEGCQNSPIEFKDCN